MHARRKNVEPRSRCNAAFTLPDAAALTLAAGLFAALILAGAGATRHHARAAASQAQLRWIAGVTASYAADYQDRQWALSWTEGAIPSAFPDLQQADTSQQAVSNQAVDIIRRRGGEADLPRTTNWVPSIYYSHLPLADYLDVALPMLDFVAPADEHRLNWARDREAFAHGEFLPFQPNPILAVNKRWPYSSSYQLGIALASSPWSGQGAMLQGETQDRFYVSGTRFEGVLHSRIHFPSQKALLFDGAQHAPERFFLDERATVAMLMADGAAARRRTADSNLGWHPTYPGFSSYLRFGYSPAAWEPQAGAGEFVNGHYRWTRGGAEGRDFGGPEIDTGQQR